MQIVRRAFDQEFQQSRSFVSATAPRFDLRKTGYARIVRPARANGHRVSVVKQRVGLGLFSLCDQQRVSFQTTLVQAVASRTLTARFVQPTVSPKLCDGLRSVAARAKLYQRGSERQPVVALVRVIAFVFRTVSTGVSVGSWPWKPCSR